MLWGNERFPRVQCGMCRATCLPAQAGEYLLVVERVPFSEVASAVPPGSALGGTVMLCERTHDGSVPCAAQVKETPGVRATRLG